MHHTDFSALGSSSLMGMDDEFDRPLTEWEKIQKQIDDDLERRYPPKLRVVTLGDGTSIEFREGSEHIRGRRMFGMGFPITGERIGNSNFYFMSDGSIQYAYQPLTCLLL